MAEKLLYIDLPVGAILGGWRHLGGGTFVGHPLPDSKELTPRAQMVIDGFTTSRPTGNIDLPATVVADELAEAQEVSRRVWSVAQTVNGRPIEESDYCELLGFSEDERQRRYALYGVNT